MAHNRGTCGGTFTAKMIAAEKGKGGTTACKAKAALRHARQNPNVTGRIKERIAQSKRTRASSLAIVDKPRCHIAINGITYISSGFVSFSSFSFFH